MTAGLVGFVDFAGYPVGLGSPRGGGFSLAQRHLSSVLLQNQLREYHEGRARELALASLLAARARRERLWEAHERALGQMKDAAVAAVLMAEV